MLARNRKSRFLASCDWLVEMEAITQEQVAMLNHLRQVRQHVAHELPAFLVDPSYVASFVVAVTRRGTCARTITVARHRRDRQR